MKSLRIAGTVRLRDCYPPPPRGKAISGTVSLPFKQGGVDWSTPSANRPRHEVSVSGCSPMQGAAQQHSQLVSIKQCSLLRAKQGLGSLIADSAGVGNRVPTGHGLPSVSTCPHDGARRVFCEFLPRGGPSCLETSYTGRSDRPVYRVARKRTRPCLYRTQTSCPESHAVADSPPSRRLHLRKAASDRTQSSWRLDE